MNARTQRRKDAKKKGERGRGKERGRSVGGRKGAGVWGEEEGKG